MFLKENLFIHMPIPLGILADYEGLGHRNRKFFKLVSIFAVMSIASEGRDS